MNIAEAAETPLQLIVVEDCSSDFDLLALLLRAYGWTATFTRVESAESLRRALRSGPCSAVISDHLLPGFSSVEALAIVRVFDPFIPFLVVSGTIGLENAVAVMRAGADDYIMKDDLARLPPSLRRALATAAARRRQREAEVRLVESEARFRALAANLPGIVFQLRSVDNGLDLTYVNDGSQRLLGISPEAIFADPGLLLDLVGPGAQQKMAAALAARGGVPPPHVDWVRQLDNAQGLDVEWVKFAARARIDSDGSTLWDCAVNDVTPQTRAELELRESREELRELALHLTHVREEERESIAREIHDDVGSTLFAAKYNLAWLKLQVHDNDAVTAKHLQMDQLLDSAIHASTRIMHDLRPGILDEGIVASLEWQARSFEQRMGIACTFKCSQEDLALDRNWSIALFRICQEALNNVAKHAHATVVVVTLEVNERKIELEVRDNGIGVSPGDARKLDCFGLRGMRERVESLGGTLRVSKGLEWGTTVAASFPRAGALLQLPLQPELAT